MSRLLDETDFGTSFEGVRDKVVLEVFMKQEFDFLNSLV